MIEYCAPTLASLKTANLFNCRFYSETELNRQLAVWNEALGQKGIALLTLHREENKALIYVYRKSRLEADLNKEGVADFLTRFGYERRGPDSALDFLKKRIREEKNFPHEIGIFLDILWGTSLVLFRIKEKIASAPAVGKSTAMNARQRGCSKNSENVSLSIGTFGARAEASGN